MINEALKDRLKRWGYAQQINDKAKPILELAEEGRLIDFELSLCRFALQVIEDVRVGIQSPKEADDLFVLIDNYISEKEIGDELSDEIHEIILEGHHFHHFGEDYGPDVTLMKNLIEKFLGQQKEDK